MMRTPHVHPVALTLRFCIIDLLSIITLLLVSAPLYAQSRPKIGLVLEGGGAMGFAHVGVLKILREQRIPIDFVAGTSMGAIVGGAYASGVSLEDMEKILTETNWGELFSESAPRRRVPYRYKAGREREIFGDTKISFGEDGIQIPSGAIQGQHIQPLFQRMFDRVPVPVDFDALPIPFRAVTADLETGEAVVPNKADLSRIVRASMSVPGVFAPVDWKGKLLVDGGITNNLPVDIAKQMGAEVVIAVALPGKPKKRSELGSPFSIAGQILSFLLAQNATVQRGLLEKEDLLIEVDLGDLGPSDFASGEEIVSLGEAAGKEYVDQLHRFSVSHEEYEAFEHERSRLKQEERHIRLVRVEEGSRLSERAIRKVLGVGAGEVFDRAKVEAGIEALFETGQYEEVRYETVSRDDGLELIVHAKKKEWLNDFLRVGAAFEDDFEGDANYRFALNYRLTDITSVRSYLDTNVELGRNPSFLMELYQPLNETSPYFVAPRMGISDSRIFFRNDGDIVAEYGRLGGALALAAGRELGTIGEVRAEVDRGFGELEKEIGADTLPEFSYDTADASFALVLDSLDDVDFPTEGFRAFTFYRSSLEELGASDEFHELSLSFTKPFNFGRSTLIYSGEIIQAFDERPGERSLSLGGFLDLSGFEQSSVIASDLQIHRLIALRRFSDAKIPLLGLSYFAGASVEHGVLRSDIEAFNDPGDIWAGSVFLGIDTPVLPAYLAFGMSDENEKSIYLIVGRLSRPVR